MIFKPLDTLAKIVAGQSPESSTYNSTGQGLPFFQGKADFQDTYPTVRMWCTSEKRKISEPDDILISVRAPVGAVNICNQRSIIGRGLAAIRPLSQLHGKFLYYYLRANERQIDALGTGSTFKAITQDTLKKIEIPVPPLDDQIRIAHLLGKVEGLIAQRKQHLQQFDDLLKSVFLEMFGDPVRNEKGWDRLPLEKLGSLNRGVSKHRPRNAPELLGGKYPLIQTGEVSNAGTYITTFSHTYSDIGFAQSKLWPSGTLCITIAANIAQTGVLTFDACFPDSVVAFSAFENEAHVLYVHGLFWFFQKILEKNAPAAAQKNINLEILRGMEVPKPPIELQVQFAFVVEKIERIKSSYQQSLNDLETLYGALSQQAFKGELDLSRVPLLRQVEEEPNLTKQSTMESTTPTSFQLPDPESIEWLVVENRQKLIAFWLDAWSKHYAEEPFSVSRFMDDAYQRLAELSEQNAFQLDKPGKGLDEAKVYGEPEPFGIHEYEHIKTWVFEALDTRTLTQAFDDAGNRIELKAVQA